MYDLLRLAMLVAVLVLPLAAGAATTVYKCAGNAGAVVYQDVPCAPSKELRNLTTEPPSLSIVPGTPVPGGKPAQAVASKPERTAAREHRKTDSGKAVDRKFITIGMSADEVVQRIGKPDIDARNRRGQGQQWSYLPKDGDPNTITTLTMIDGKVAEVERKIVR
jgi:hypothetical protein